MKELLFPTRCVICDRPVAGEEGVCRNCRGKLVYMQEPTCMKCGKTLLDENALYCTDCQETAHAYVRGFGLYVYETIKASLYRYKYEGRREYASFFAAQIANRWGSVLESLGADGIVPVPIAEEKLLSRGYNQAYLIADALGKRLGIPVYDGLVRRVKSTKPMKELGPKERKDNLKGAFKLCPNDVKLETIIVLDDIYTTGSTVDAVCKVLQSGGVRECYVITLAIGKGI